MPTIALKAGVWVRWILLISLLPLSVLAQQARPGIDCDCSTTGTWVSPAIGRDLDVRLGGSSPQNGSSPNGTYNNIHVPFDFTQTAITITRAGDGVQVFHGIFGLGSGWGFSPDDDRFVVHSSSSQGAHFVRLYDLSNNGTLVTDFQPGIIDMGYIAFSPKRHHAV